MWAREDTESNSKLKLSYDQHHSIPESEGPVASHTTLGLFSNALYWGLGFPLVLWGIRL